MQQVLFGCRGRFGLEMQNDEVARLVIILVCPGLQLCPLHLRHIRQSKQ